MIGFQSGNCDQVLLLTQLRSILMFPSHFSQLVDSKHKYKYTRDYSDQCCLCCVLVVSFQHGMLQLYHARISQKLCKLAPKLLSNVNMKSYAICRMVSFPVTLCDPNPGFKVTVLFKGQFFQTGAFFIVQVVQLT